MAFIAPFCGVRFNPAKIKRLEDVVTPPYDVIDEKKQDIYQNRNPYNMIFLDISKDPGLGDTSARRYQQSRDHFVNWQQEEILVQDSEPAIYLYCTDYTLPTGERRTRKGLVSLVRLCEFSEDVVKPHEETFATVTSDRLKLLDATRAQFSQIFSLYQDREGEILATLEAARNSEPISEVCDADGVCHTVWAVTDRQTIARAGELFQKKSLYIADGHHRYSTALRYRKQILERDGEIADDSPFNYTMMYLCPAEDPGLAVLTPHRLVRVPDDVLPASTTVDELAARLSAGFSLEEISDGSRETLVAELHHRLLDDGNCQPEENATRLGLYHAGEDRCFLMTLKNGAMQGKILEREPVLRDLDVVVLSDFVLGHCLGLQEERCENENLVRFFSELDVALDVAVKESVELEDSMPLLFLMNNTQVTQVIRVADKQLVMPHKSTFFYPKVVTGLLMYKLAEPDSGG